MEYPSEERLPDAEEVQPEFYEKDKGSAGIHGQIFEYKFCALLFLRAKNKGYKFKLASNAKGFGAFDDVVVEYLDATSRQSHIFLQLKSKARRLITMSQLKSKDGDFSLRKYYESYIQIEEKFNSSEEGVKIDGRIDESLFVIYTNADVGQDLKCSKGTEVGEEEFLTTGCSVLQFDKEEHKAIYEHLQELPKHREFLSRFRIFYSQADEKKMDCHIKRELQQSMQLPDTELELAYMCFLDFIKDWWQNSNFFLKETNSKEIDPMRKTSEKVRTTLVAKILEQRKCELDELNFKYKESAITDIKQLIQPHKAVLIFAPGGSTTLTAAKIHQMLSATTHIILNLQQLVRYKTDVMLAWKHSFNVMVLEGDSFVNDFQDLANEISIILNKYDVEKKFIFVSDRLGKIQQISVLRQTFSTLLTEEYDDWRVTDIITESRTFFLEKNIIFQGSEMQIKNLVRESDVRMLNALDCDSMSLLLGNEKPSIGIPIENTLEYYIDRKLQCVKYVKPGIHNESEVLVPFRGERLEELQGISAYRERNWKGSNYEQGIPQHILANENAKHSRILCNETENLQGLCTEEESRLWRQNTDDFGNAHRQLERETTAVWRPTTLFDGDGRIILLTDEPGMGKSTLLSHLAKETRERRPDMWIVRVNINSYTNILHEIQTNGFDEKGALKLLTQAAEIKEKNGIQLEKQLFNYFYNSTGNMAVMIDGVDEVSPHYTEEVIQILRILFKTKIRKLWVTSRNSVKYRLEQELHCRSHSLTPFSLEDQKSFLVQFWNQIYPNTKREYIENLAKRVLELSFKHLSHKERDFMGIPLQSMLLAEVFGENLKHCSTSATVQLPVNLNLVMLYDLYVKKKWDIYLSDKKVSDRTNVNVLTDDDALHDIFIDNHKAAALMAILSTNHLEKLNDKNVLKKGNDFLQKINQGLEKTGIITDVIEGRPVFQHRTFAEYFVARWLCDNFLVSHRFMRDHIFESGFRVVRSMVDRILANKCPLHEAVLNSNMRNVAKMMKRNKTVTQKDRGGRTPLHVAVSCRNPELIRLLLEHGADVSSVDTLLGLSAVQYATRMVDIEILSLIMEKRPEIREQVLNEINHVHMEHNASVIRAAAKCGHTDLLRYLISKENCVNISLPGDNGTLLHEAVRGNHIQTVRTLVDLGASCDIEDANGKTALHVSAEAGSLEVAKFMVERQEISSAKTDFKYIVNFDRAITKLNRLNVRDKDGNTPLHLAASAGNTNMLDYLLSAGSDLGSSNLRGEYPLTLAARYGRNDSVKLLLQRQCVVKCDDIMTSALTAAIVAGQVETTALLLRSGALVSGDENEKPIHAASRMGHKDIVSLLLQHGANLNTRTERGHTALHLASEAGHLSLVKYLVVLQRDQLEIPNYENETSLHLAARNGRDYLVKYFVENGCSINAISANSSTCLHVACENGHYTTVEYLLKHGAKVNAKNSAHKTPLHIAASRGQTEIVALLSLHNANISLRDADGITALLAASRHGHQDTVRFIVQHGGNIQDTDGNGNTIAHFAVANENHDILKFESKHNVKLDVQNSDGDTPLLQAVREGRNRIVQYLVDENCDINTQGNDGMTPLDVAVLKDNMEITRLLLERNARSGNADMHMVAAARFGFLDLLQGFVATREDINMKTEYGEGPLHVACKSGQVATVQYLSEHGALLDLQDNSGNTALHVAVSNGHLELTRVLVEKGANLAVANASGSTALHIATKGGYVNIVQFLADSFAPIDMRNAKKQTALLVATAEGHEKIVRFLIERGAGIGVKDIEGKTAFDIATEKGFSEITQLLKDRAEGRLLVCFISHTDLHTVADGDHCEDLKRTTNAGASVDRATDQDNTDTAQMLKIKAKDALAIYSNHHSALNSAAENGYLEEVQRLVKVGIALDYGDTFGRNALWGAASRGHKSIIRYLLENGSFVNIPDCEGMTPIDIAARESHWEAVDELLMYDPTIRHESTDILKNNLHKASENGNLEVVRIIIKCGIKVDTTNEDAYTPLHAAAKSGHKEVIRILLNAGANINATDNSGRTPLILAAENGHVDIIRELLSTKATIDSSSDPFSVTKTGHVEAVQGWLNHGASVDIANNEGETPLYKASLNGHVEVVRELLSHGASVDIENNEGVTPLYKASVNGHVEVVRELLSHGASVVIANYVGSTPLYKASLNGHVEVVRELLSHGASVDIANKKCDTPLNTASFKGHAEVVRELLNYGAGVDIADNKGWTPLNAAGSEGHVEVVRELLNHGASVDIGNNEGATPLYKASLNGHVEVVRELLSHGASVEIANKNGWTPLNTAASRGHLEVVRELLDHGASVDIAKNESSTPLYIASLNGHMDVIRELLSHGAGVDIANKNGWTPLNTAASRGHLEVVRELLDHGAGVDIANKNGWTPLNTAASRGHLEVVRELLDHGASVDIANDEGATPLFISSLNGHVDVVRELLSHGASVEIANKNGWTPLNTAASRGHLEVVRELLDHGAGVDIANKNGWTPLNTAVDKGHVEVVRELLSHGASVEIANENGRTPLNTAASRGHLEVVRELLDHGASVDIANHEGATPLCISSLNGHVDIVRELLSHGASVEIENKNGWTPLNTAASRGHLEVVRELLDHGAGVDIANKNGWTPLNTAASRGHLEVVRELLDHGASVDIANDEGATPLFISSLNGHVDVVRELLSHGASVEIANKNGWTPLNTAASRGHLEVVRELLDHGAGVDIANKNGWTPLNTAVDKGHVEVVRELLSHGASVEIANENGRTPLNTAAFRGHLEVVRELLDNGASVDIANNEGATPLYIASLNGHVGVVRELLSHGASEEIANENGWTPLNKAASRGHLEVVRDLLEHGASVEIANNEGWTPLNTAASRGHLEVVRELLDHCASVDIADNEGWTPLHAAGSEGNVEVVRELLNHGASVDIANNVGSTPLYNASLNGHVDVVRELLNHGASVDIANKNGDTPLNIASFKGHSEVVRELLNHGASVDIADNEGWTPLNAAGSEGHVEIVRDLLNHGAGVDIANNEGATTLYKASLNGQLEVVRELLNHGASVDISTNNGSTPLKAAVSKGHEEVILELQKHGASSGHT